MAVPKIRFPEFSDDWKLCSLEDILTERNVKQTISEDAPLLSFTIEQGVINPEDKKTNKRDFLMKDKSTKIFALTEVDDIIYNPANLKFGAIHRNKLRRGVVSPIYAIFYTNQSPAFVEALVRNPRFIKKSLTFLEGSVIKLMTLKPRDFVKMQVYIPSIEEQKRIADLLNKIDIVIARCQTEIEKTKELKRGLLQKMFPKAGQNTPELRFPGFTEAWEQRKLGEVADIVGGGTPSTSNDDYWDGDIDWYAPAEIADQIYVASSERKITQQGYDNSSAKMLPVGTVLFTSRAGIGKTAILRKEGCTNQGFQSIVPHINELDSYFIFSRSEEMKRYGETVGAGSTFVEVSGKQMANMKLMMPTTMEEQVTIGSFFSNLESLITLHQRECEKWQDLKKGLLQQIFI